MSEFPSLAEAIDTHLGVWRVFSSDEQQQDFCADLADAWREACTITTVEQLDALPNLSAIRDGITLICEKRGGKWFTTDDTYCDSDELKLPALLIWSPDWARP